MIGIDIGSTHIKAVEVMLKGKNPEVIRATVIPIQHSVLSDSEMDQNEIITVLKQGLKDAGIHGSETAISLMESQVFTRIIQTPALSDKELSQALQWEAERYIPLPLSEVAIDSTITEKGQSTMEVMLVASPIRLIEKYTGLFKKAGVSVNAIENEALSVLRVFKEDNVNSVVVDIGGNASNLYVIHGEHLILVNSISLGGIALTKALSTEHNIALNQAEEYKRTYGLRADQMNGQVAKTLSLLIDPFITEISGSMAFFKDRFPEDVVSKIILIGGGAGLPGLPEYIQEKTQVATIIGNPWLNLGVNSTVASQSKGMENYFSIATGLAIRELE